MGKVLLIAPDSLQALFATAAGVDAIRGAGDIAEQAFDVHIPLLSLPTVLGTTLDTIPNEVPYLHVPPTAASTWRRTNDPPIAPPSTLHAPCASASPGPAAPRRATTATAPPAWPTSRRCSRFPASNGTACRWGKRRTI